MDKLFKIRASAGNKILGRTGLTEIQEKKLNELSERKSGGGKPLTFNMEMELVDLLNKKANPGLPATCTTYLKQWYAGDTEDIYSKEMDKGNMVEPDLLDMAADKLGFGFAEKNIVRMETEYFTGTADIVLPNCIIDVKAPWNNKTFQDSVMLAEIDKDYEIQGRIYMHLYNKPEFILFYGLVDTPEEANYGTEISFAHIPENERWIAYKIKRDVTIEQEIIARVIECRAWLEEYDKKVKSRLGKVIEI
jgi:hypothetical protein